MTIVAFDTLRFSRNLAEAGLAPAQADGIAAATAGALAEVVGQLATRDDLASQNLALGSEIAAVRHELRAEIAALRQETKAEIAALRQETKAEIVGLRRDLAELELRMTIKLGTMMAGAVALTAALVRLL